MEHPETGWFSHSPIRIIKTVQKHRLLGLSHPSHSPNPYHQKYWAKMRVFFHSAQESQENPGISLDFPVNWAYTAFFSVYAQKSLEFKEMLERRTGLEVIMWDERLTTVEANRTLMEASVRRENRKQYLDQLAAVFILQGYLDYRKNRSE